MFELRKRRRKKSVSLNSEIQVQLGIGGRPNVGIMDKNTCDAENLKIKEALENIEEEETATEDKGLITDKNPPSITVNIIKSDITHSNITLTVTDDVGLSEDNRYEYCLSSSNTEIKDCEFKEYESERPFEENSPNRYLWVYPIRDNAGNYNGTYTNDTIPYVISSYNLLVVSQTFNYTGGAQYFSPTVSGNYEIELWGASSGRGGHGAWSGGGGGKGGSGLGSQANGGQTYGFSGDECPNGVIGRCYSCDGGSGEAGSFGYNPSYATFITGSAGARNGNGLATIKFIG